MKDPKIVIQEALGWEPEITSQREPDDGLVVFSFRSLTEPDTLGQIVMSETADAAVIKVGDDEEYVLSPLDGPQNFNLEMVFRITDKVSWAEATEGSPEDITAAFFGDIPINKGISWGVATLEQDGENVLVTVPVSVTERSTAAAYVREAREAMWNDTWVPVSMREMAFEAMIGSSDAPGPDHFGFEILNDEEWKRSSPLTDAINKAEKILAETEAADCWSLDEVAEGGVVKVYVNNPSWRSALIAVSDQTVDFFPVTKALGLMKDPSLLASVEP